MFASFYSSSSGDVSRFCWILEGTQKMHPQQTPRANNPGRNFLGLWPHWWHSQVVKSKHVSILLAIPFCWINRTGCSTVLSGGLQWNMCIILTPLLIMINLFSGNNPIWLASKQISSCFFWSHASTIHFGGIVSPCSLYNYYLSCAQKLKSPKHFIQPCHLQPGWSQ